MYAIPRPGVVLIVSMNWRFYRIRLRYFACCMALFWILLLFLPFVWSFGSSILEAFMPSCRYGLFRFGCKLFSFAWWGIDAYACFGWQACVFRIRVFFIASRFILAVISFGGCLMMFGELLGLLAILERWSFGECFSGFCCLPGETVLSLDCPLDDIVSCVDTVGFIGLLALDSLREAA